MLKNREAVNEAAARLGPTEAANGSENTDMPVKGLAQVKKMGPGDVEG